MSTRPHTDEMVLITARIDALLTETFGKRIAFSIIVAIIEGQASMYSNVDNDYAYHMVGAVADPTKRMP